MNLKDDFSLVITPEGTRSWVPKWRKGFYHMAIYQSSYIIVLEILKKTIHLGKQISVQDLETRSFESIMQELEDYYKTITQISKNGILKFIKLMEVR